MNYNKHTFKVDEFMAFPICESGNEAPFGVPFLLKGRMSNQKNYLSWLIKEHTEEGLRKEIEKQTQENPKKDHRIKVNFWRKHKDGNVSEYGGTIEFVAPGITLKDDKVILNFGEDLKFEKTEYIPTEEVGTEL
jgi:hypothetical protein